MAYRPYQNQPLRPNKKYSASASQLHGAARFRIERELSETLQGRIYAGTDLVTQQPCVIKEAWRQLVHSGRSRNGHRVPENFLHERQMLMDLSLLPNVHSGIVKGIDEWDDAHCYYYAMEYCCGELFDFISSQHASDEYQKIIENEAIKIQTPMKEANGWIIRVSSMFKQICESVAWMHDNSYCHLDLSLENTMIADMQTGNVKIIDLGLAQHFKNGNFKHTGKIGKLQYMCPEAYNRQEYDARAADVYCLGIMLFMMLIGAPPYQAPQPQNAAFNYFINGRIADVLKHWKTLRLVTDDALDLMCKIICYQENRIDIHAILKHPFLRDYNKINENDANDYEEKQPIKHSEQKPQPINNNNDQPDQNDTHDTSITITTTQTTTTTTSATIDNEDMNAINQGISDMSLQSTNEQEIVIMDENDDDIHANDANMGGLDDDDDDNEDAFELFDDNNNSNNNNFEDECSFILNQLNLLKYANKMNDRGWGMPNDWHHLNEFILKYEIGFEDADAKAFMERYSKYTKWKEWKHERKNYDLKNKPNRNNNNNTNNEINQ